MLQVPREQEPRLDQRETHAVEPRCRIAVVCAGDLVSCIMISRSGSLPKHSQDLGKLFGRASMPSANSC